MFNFRSVGVILLWSVTCVFLYLFVLSDLAACFVYATCVFKIFLHLVVLFLLARVF